MSLRCKPGDFCVVINGGDFPANIGRFCTVLRSPTKEDDADADWIVAPATTLWGTDPDTGEHVDDGYDTCIDDFHIFPIRGQSGEDEILRIAGEPEKVSA